MTTLINADTVVGGAVITGDASGNLALQSGGVTGLTVSSGGAVSFSGAVSGIPGSGGTISSGSVVLTSASTGAQSITTTNYGQTITLPNATTLSDGACLYTINNLGAYPLKIVNNAGSTLGFVITNNPVTVGLADNSTAAGTWSLINSDPFAVTAQTFSTALYNRGNISSIGRSVVIDSNRTLLLFGSTNIYGIIYDTSTSTWGTTTLIRTATISNYAAVLSATDQVLVCSNNTATGMEAVTLTLSGTTITVNTAATATLSAADNSSSYSLVAVGTSWVVQYGVATPALQMRALTISGTTVTIGAATVLNGTTLTNVYVTAVSASVALVTSNTTASTFFATPYTISGTTITVGTGATYATSVANSYKILPISSGARWAVIIINTAQTNVIGLIISVAGTTASISSATLATAVNANDANNSGIIVSGSKLIYVPYNPGSQINILTDSAGTASAGTAITPFSGASTQIPISVNTTTNLATFHFRSAGGTAYGRILVNFSGASPVLSAVDSWFCVANTFSDIGDTYFSSNLSTGLFYGTTSYTYATNNAVGQRSIAINENSFYSFMAKSSFPAGGVSNSLAIANNKKWLNAPTPSGSTNYGMLQIIESTT